MRKGDAYYCAIRAVERVEYRFQIRLNQMLSPVAGPPQTENCLRIQLNWNSERGGGDGQLPS